MSPIAARSESRVGKIKGQPLRFIPGHGRHQKRGPRPNHKPGANPDGLCQCGCGEQTPMAKYTDLKRGLVRGKPLRFCPSHWHRIRLDERMRADDGMATCRKCGEAKPATVEWFVPNVKSRRGIRTICKRCHAEETYEANRAWRLSHPEVQSAASKRWKKANPIEHKAQADRRRAAKAKADGSHTAVDIRCQYARQGGRCFYCGARVGDDYHVDHVIPLSRGGSDGPENLVVACPFCNVSKGAKHPMDFCGRLL